MIAGCMRLYPGSLPTAAAALTSLRSLTDRLYLLLQGDLEEADLRGLGCPAGTVWDRWPAANFDHEAQLTACCRLADPDRPEWVLFPDSDELLPHWRVPELLRTAAAAGRSAVAFPFLVPWESNRRVVNPKLVPTAPHVKACRWVPDLNFVGTGGFCVPEQHRQSTTHSVEALAHLYALTPGIRQLRKRLGATCERFFEGPAPELVDAPPSWSELKDLLNHALLTGVCRT